MCFNDLIVDIVASFLRVFCEYFASLWSATIVKGRHLIGINRKSRAFFKTIGRIWVEIKTR